MLVVLVRAIEDEFPSSTTNAGPYDNKLPIAIVAAIVPANIAKAQHMGTIIINVTSIDEFLVFHSCHYRSTTTLTIELLAWEALLDDTSEADAK